MIQIRRLSIVLPFVCLLLASLACQAARHIFEAEQPAFTPEIPVPSELHDEAPALQSNPDTAAVCLETTASILETATAYEEGDFDDEGSEELEEQYLVSYFVSGDQIEDPYFEEVSAGLVAFQQDEARHLEIWRLFTSLVPASDRAVLAEYSIVTDGEGALLAAVGQTSFDPNAWGLEVDISDADDRLDLTYTLIHEFAHLLTLGPDQVTPSLAVFNNPEDEDVYLQEVSACRQYFPGEGCALPEAYINAFYDLFWADIHSEWQDINLIEDDEQYYQAFDDFYYTYEDRFVTDYAATNPEEDIAEAFTFFVLLPRPNGTNISDEKIRFFYAYPELVQLREHILKGVCEQNQ